MGKGYKTTCPSCGGHNFYVTPHNGVGYCFNCGHVERAGGGSKPMPARSRYRDGIRAVYTAYAHWCHEQMRDEHYAYLERRGISRATADAHGIGYCPVKLFTHLMTVEAYEAGLVTRDRKPFLAGRLVIPYVNSDGQVVDMRGRLYDPQIAVAPEVKYLSPYRSAQYRWADMPYNVAALRSPRLVITEGELKALASQQAGIPTVALPGIRSFRSGLVVNPGADVVICFDHQRKHMDDVIRAIHELARRLLPYGPQVRVATLPLGDDDEKMDIDTYIVRYGEQRYRDVIRQALPYDVWSRLVRV